MTAEVLPWRYPPVPDVLDSEWLRSAYEAGTIPAREAAPDLAIVLAQAHAADHAGRGPSARGGDQREGRQRARAVYLGEAEDSWDGLAPNLRPYAGHVNRGDPACGGRGRIAPSGAQGLHEQCSRRSDDLHPAVVGRPGVTRHSHQAVQRWHPASCRYPERQLADFLAPLRQRTEGEGQR